ncbi:MAG: SdrD B-like domain-containing protein [Chloroflexota bacterium]
MFHNQIIRVPTRIRSLFNALMIAALLAGLIPRPALTHLARTMASGNPLGTLEPIAAKAAEAAAERAVMRSGTASGSEAVNATTVVRAAPGDNLALNGTATQSSTLVDVSCGPGLIRCMATAAIDGNTSGAVLAGDGVAITLNSDPEPWWQVDLGSIEMIETIGVWEQTDNVAGIDATLDNAYLLVSDTPFTADDLAGARAQADFEALLGVFSPSTQVSVNQFGRYVRIHDPDTNYLRIAEVEVIQGTSTGEIYGTAFFDANLNGIQDNAEAGISDINVTAVDANGTSTTVTTAVSGAFTVTAGVGLLGMVRVEFTLPTDGSLDHLAPTVAGETTVQFIDVTNGVLFVDAGFYIPDEYCQENPQIATSCYALGATNNAQVSSEAAVLEFTTISGVLGNGWPETNSFGLTPEVDPVMSSGPVGPTGTGNAILPASGHSKIVNATIGEIGTVNGIAYHRRANTLLAASFMKRFTSFPPPVGWDNTVVNRPNDTALGTIYAIDRDTNPNAISAFYIANAGTDSHDYSTDILGATTGDVNARDDVGFVGWGDIDMSDDEAYLYAVNLFDASIHMVAVNPSGTTVTAGTATVIPFPAAVTSGLCTNDDWRPGGLKIQDGQVYVTVTCTGQTSLSNTDLHLYIYRFPAGNTTPTFTQVASTSLNYSRPYAWGYWRAADENLLNYTNIDQPWGIDIEFDKQGNLFVGLANRAAHQLSGASANIINFYIEWGDTIRATPNGDGTFTFGNLGTEFIQDGTTVNHDENDYGHLVTLWPTDSILSTSGVGGLVSGVRHYSTVDGSPQRYYGIVQLDNDGAELGDYFGKLAGLGDLEVLCRIAPLEIGNRVWWDPNENGVQDPGEAAIPNVQLELWLVDENDILNDGDDLATVTAILAATTTTDSEGRYYFSHEGDPTKDNVNGYADQLWQNSETAVRHNRTYQVRIPNYDTGGSANDTAIRAANGGVDFYLAQKGNGGATNGNLRDSNAYDNPGNAAVVVNTGGPGQNNHTLDIGFSANPPEAIEIAKWSNTPPTVTVGSQISFTIRITNTGSVTITTLPLTDTYDIAYLAYNGIADINGPNPATEADDDGAIYWANVLSHELTDQQLAPNEVFDVIVVFDTVAATTGIAAAECATTGNTYNKATAMGMDACVEVPIDPGEAKLTLGDVIWHDIDNDGTQDASEPGINGVVVNLYDVTGGGNTFITTTTTVLTNTVDGFYQFDVVSGNDYRVEVASSNFGSGGPLAGFVLGANQGTINNDADPDQSANNVTVNDDTLDFGFYCEFDLALVKTLASGQSATIAPGDDVRFTLTVYNQGTVTATNVTVADYIPTDFTLSGANAVTWNGGASGTVTTTLAATLTPSGTVNASTIVDIVLTAGATTNGTYTNTAEIASYNSTLTDGAGNELPDVDSDPDTTNSEDPVKNDVIDEDGKNNAADDEDDHDPASVTVSTAPIYDLALIKTVASQSDTPLAVGSTVTFTIQVLNQGTAAATNPEIVDYVPAGLTVADANWSNDGATGPVNATRTLNTTIAAGSSTTTQIVMTVASIPASRTITNTAEIAVDDGDDVDSTPDSTDGDTVVDNASLDDATNNVDNDGDSTVDEDDHDIAPVYLCDDGEGDLGGTVWRDFNSDGNQDGSEPDFSNATVTAYGNDDNVGITIPLNPDGTYTFPDLFDTNTHIRLEFRGLPSYMQPSFHGSTPGAAVMTQRHDAATCEADLAVNNPADYCESVTDIATACFLFGDQLTGPHAALDALVAVAESASGNSPAKTLQIPASDIGATWGLAYRTQTNVLYSASFIKRHSGLGPSDNPTTIYVTDLGTNVTTEWLTLDAARVNPHPNGTADFLRDFGTFDDVLKEGLGDLDIAEDGNTLYTIDLQSRELVIIPINADGSAGTPTNVDIITAVSTVDVMAQCTNDAGAFAADDLRPFGLGIQDGELYVGMICSAQSTVDEGTELPIEGPYSNNNVINRPGDQNKLRGYIFRWDGATGFNEVLDFPLDYERGCSNNLGNPACLNSFDAKWNAWVDTYPFYANQGHGADHTAHYPVPAISDIEFDNGDMVIGLIDRFGHQWGPQTQTPSYPLNNGGGEGFVFAGSSGGDLLRACADGSGGWAIESLVDPTNASCDTRGTSSSADGALIMDEYYYQDDGNLNLANPNVGHSEEIVGGVLQIPGRSEVIASSINPQRFEGNKGGFAWHNNATGAHVQGARLYSIVQNTPNEAFFGKAEGLGDVVAFCDLAPLEIGNYVWLDSDGDGVQDPCEEPIPGVQVSLYNITGTLVAQTTTDANGEYYFSDSSVGNQTWSVGTSLTPSTTYEIEIDLNQTVTVSGTQYLLSDLTPSPIQGAAGSQAFNDEHDSDGVLNGGVVETTAVTGAAGHNDHSFDFGFVQQNFTPMIQVDKQFNGVGDYRVGETISFTIRITNTGDVVIDTLPMEDRYSQAFLEYRATETAPPADSANNGILTWTDVLNSLGDTDGLGISETVNVDVYFTTRADTSLLPALLPCSDRGHTPNLARSVGAVGGGVTVVEDADDQDCDSVEILNPTAVQLASSSLTQTPDGVLVRWQVEEESNVVGFYIWKTNGLVSTRSSELIPTPLNGQSRDAGSYEWLEAGATLKQGDVYMLEVVKSDGSNERMVIDVVNGGEIFMPFIVR